MQSLFHRCFTTKALKKYKALQASLSKKVIKKNIAAWMHEVTNGYDFPGLKRIGGIDISTNIKQPDKACVCMSILSYPELEVINCFHELVVLKEEYVCNYLAFREVPHFKKVIDKVKKNHNDIFPQIIMVDGGGLLHSRKFGSASHLGVVCNVPTIGVQKNPMCIPEFGIFGRKKGSGYKDMEPIVTNDGEVLGMAVQSGSGKPIFVSIGHGCTLETAVKITQNVCKYRIPEPIRSADQESRHMIRKAYPSDFKQYYNEKQVRAEILRSHALKPADFEKFKSKLA